MPPITIRPYRSADAAGFVECFNRVFPDPGAGIRAIDGATFDWKYERNPLPMRHVVVAEHEAEGIVGAYPSQPVRVWMDGAERLSAQITDLMVQVEFRRSAPRPGLFVAMGLDFYARFCGTGPDRQIFNYGWPVPAWRMGQRYLRYQNVRDWNALFREFDRPGAPPAGIEIRRVERFGADADALFERLRPTFGLTLVRDASYLNWRYADCSDRAYRLFECRDGAGALRAWFVLGCTDFLRPNTCYVVDWLLPADDDEAMAAIVAHAERTAFEAGSRVVAGVWNPVDPRFWRLQELGFRLFDTRYFIVVASFGYETTFFRDEWIFTMGDSDLV